MYHLHSSIDAVHLFNEHYKRHNTIFIDLKKLSQLKFSNLKITVPRVRFLVEECMQDQII